MVSGDDSNCHFSEEFCGIRVQQDVSFLLVSPFSFVIHE